MSMSMRQPVPLFTPADAPLSNGRASPRPAGPCSSDVEFALRDAQNMLALLAANVEVLGQPRDPTADASVTGDIREGTRRLGHLLGIISALLRQP